MENIVGSDACGQLALATAGTPYMLAIPPKRGTKVKLDIFAYTPAGTPHTGYVMRSIGTTTLSGAAATGQAVINLVADPSGGVAPGPIAAGDFVIVKSSASGIYWGGKVSSVSTLAITLTANVPFAAAAGDTVWFYGAPTDTHPATGLPHPSYPFPASTATVYSGPVSGVGLVGSRAMNTPILVVVDNVTAQGVFNRAGWIYRNEPGSSTPDLLGGLGLSLGGEDADGDEFESEAEDADGRQAIFGRGGRGGGGTGTGPGPIVVAVGDALKKVPWGDLVKILIGLATNAASGSGGTQNPPTPPTPPGPPAGAVAGQQAGGKPRKGQK